MFSILFVTIPRFTKFSHRIAMLYLRFFNSMYDYNFLPMNVFMQKRKTKALHGKQSSLREFFARKKADAVIF